MSSLEKHMMMSETMRCCMIAAALLPCVSVHLAQAQTAAAGYSISLVSQGGGVDVVSAMAADSAGKVYLGCLGGTGRLWEFDPPSGALRRVIDGLPLSAPWQIIIGDGSTLLGSELVIADMNSEISLGCCDGRVLRVNRSTGAASVIVGSLTAETDDPSGIALGHGAFGAALYVMNMQGNSLDRPRLFAIPSTGAPSVFAENPVLWTGARNPSRLAMDLGGSYGGDLFASDFDSDTGDVGVLWRVSSSGTVSTFVASTDIRGVSGIAFSPAGVFGQDLFVVCGNLPSQAARVVRISPGGAQEVFVSGFAPTNTTLASLCFSPDGNTMYIGLGDKVWMVRASQCRADFNADGSVDFFDYLDFVDALSSQSPAADFNNDDVIDFFDYLDFVDAFSIGC